MNPDPSRIFPIWPQPPQSMEESTAFQTPRPPRPPFPGRINWKGKKAADKRKKAATLGGAVDISSAGAGTGAGAFGYKPPALNELQFQNRVKARRFYPKNHNNKKFASYAPFAPRNTTSFIIRAKKSGGIASLVSPCPVTPAILPTPKFSPSREGLVDMAKEEWGVDGYGSMKGLIRLRSGPAGAEEEDEVDDGSSESDVEEHVEVERRLNHDLSRFEMVYPNFAGDESGPTGYILENRVDDQDTRIAQLEEENLTLKERLFLVEREMGEFRRRMQLLETSSRNLNNNNINNNDDNDNDNDNSYSNNNNNNNNNNNKMNVNEGAGVENGDEACSEKIVGDCGESSGTPMREG